MLSKKSLPKQLQMPGVKRAFFFLVVMFVSVGLLANAGPHPVDWWVFQYSTGLLFAGQSPYVDHNFFYNPPWALLPVIPLVILDDRIGAAIHSFASLLIFAVTALRFSGDFKTSLAFMLSPFVLVSAMHSNNEWLVFAGLLLPPQVGLFFLLIKPQLSLGIMLFWLYDAWQRGRWREVVRVFGPAGVAFAGSLLLFGLYPLQSTELPGVYFNASLFPLSVPLGAALLWFGLRRKNLRLAMMSSPFLSPYLSHPGYAITLLGLTPYRRWIPWLVFFLWVVYLAWSFPHVWL